MSNTSIDISKYNSTTLKKLRAVLVEESVKVSKMRRKLDNATLRKVDWDMVSDVALLNRSLYQRGIFE